jgi:tetratricopeptide (TPR) repeat protein
VIRKTVCLLLVAWASALLAAPQASAADEFPLELTIKDDAGNPIAGAAVKVSATTGEPFAASGVTDAEGRYDLQLPDFTRAYRVEVTKEGFLPYDRPVDLASQNFQPGTTAQVGLTLPPLTAEHLYNDAAKRINDGSHKTAEGGAQVVDLLTRATTLKPELVPAWVALAFVYLDTARPAEALAAADRALAVEATSADALRSRYDALVALGRKPEASSALDALAAQVKTPDVARLLFNRGADQMKVPDLPAARASFEAALTVDPTLHQAHSALAELAIGEKNYDAALAALDRALAIAPRNFKAWERKVEVLKAAGKTQEAAAEEKRLVEAKATPTAG